MQTPHRHRRCHSEAPRPSSQHTIRQQESASSSKDNVVGREIVGSEGSLRRTNAPDGQVRMLFDDRLWRCPRSELPEDVFNRDPRTANDRLPYIIAGSVMMRSCATLISLSSNEQHHPVYLEDRQDLSRAGLDVSMMLSALRISTQGLGWFDLAR